MGLTFNGTDRGQGAANLALGNAVSVYAFSKGTPGASTRMIDVTNSRILFHRDSSAHVAFGRNFSTTGGSWTFNDPNDGTWHHYGWTYDGSAGVSANPDGYYDGVAQVVSEPTVPVGTIWTGGVTCTVGNRADGARPLGASMAWAAIHNVKLTAAEMLEAARYGYTLRGLVRLWPLFDTTSPSPDNTGTDPLTLTGTTLTDNPVLASRGRMLLTGVG